MSGNQPAVDTLRCSARSAPGSTTAVGLPMSAFPDYLAGQLQRPVVDRTGLMGCWDLDLKFTPDGVSGDTATSRQESAPSLFAALREQLGLKLEASTGMVDVLVIDRLERPSMN